MDALLTLDDAQRAAAVLDGVAHRTPVFTSNTLDEITGGHIVCKAENLQRAGAFKFRGAYNKIASLDRTVRQRGVCTISSGNHAQAVALTASLLDIPAVILMPEDAPEAKVAAVRGYGAEIVRYDRFALPQWQAGLQLEQERGLPFVSSHDDPLISAGAATAALELLDDAGPVDMLIAPVGGGGGMAGYATVVRALYPDAVIVAVEPAAGGMVAASLREGVRIEQEVPRTIADGQQLTRLGAFPLEVLRATIDTVVSVTDDEIIDAMRFYFDRLKLVTEPSGAASLAALLAGKVDAAGRRVGIMISGGNVGADRWASLLSGHR